MEKDLGKSRHPTYFSIDAILASETKVPCVTKTVIPRFGHLAPEFSDSENLPEGISVDLPIWLARVLSRHKFISVDIPNLYKDGIWEVSEVDPITTSLASYHPQFFESGLLASTAFLKKPTTVADDDLAEHIYSTLHERLLCVGDATLPKESMNTCAKKFATPLKGRPSSVPPEYLDSLERKIYDDSLRRNVEIKELVAFGADSKSDFPADIKLTQIKIETDAGFDENSNPSVPTATELPQGKIGSENQLGLDFPESIILSEIKKEIETETDISDIA